MPLRPNGVHHIAISTADIKAQIAYFTDVLGGRLVGLYWMHGTANTWHGFVELSDSCTVAFVQSPAVADIASMPGTTHALTPGHPSAAGTLQHLALNVDGHEQLLALRDRIRSRGIPAFGPVDHGMCTSVYFAGLEGLLLEISYSTEAIDQDVWIDADVVELVGITADELRAFKHPASFDAEIGSIAQPAYDPAKPHMSYPEPAYRAMLAMTDEQLSAGSDYSEPPARPA
jgi:catechol 2,3-dioxygenase-like lactoylglutathione lyase family enzyme